MEQEKNDDNRDEHGLLGQRVLERVERAVNQFAAVIKGFDADARRQARRNLRNLGFHVADDLHRVFAGAHDNDAADGFVPADVKRAAPEIAADLHGRHVLEINRRAAALRQDDVLQIRIGIDEADAAHDKFHPVFLNHLAADVQIALLYGVHDHLHRHVHRAHPQRRDINLILPHESADARDFRHAGNGVELITHEPVLNRAEPAQIVAAVWRELRVNVEIILVNPAETGRIRAEHRRDPGGHRAAEIIQPLQHARPREIIVNLVIENNRDEREAEHGIGADGLHARESLQIHRERICDLILDLLRAAPRPVGEHDDLVFAQVGNRIHRRAINGADAEADEQRHAAKHQEAVAQRPLYDAIDHGSVG